MAKTLLAAALAAAGTVAVGAAPAGPEDTSQPADPFAGLTDEDEDYAPAERTYAFNPVQARNELKVGIYYAKKGNHKAAAGRFQEAVRWDSNLAEAYWRLGTAREKLSDTTEAIRAYDSFLRLEPSSKKARQVGRRVEQLRREAAALPVAAGDPAPAGP